MVKAFLKGADGTLFPLLPKVTVIGRENCDFLIQLPGVDYQHAIIEYSEQDDCFVIQDLNTASGTYVNDVRVQNAAVRLAAGDHIRFGYNGQPFELQVENQTASAGIYAMSANHETNTVSMGTMVDSSGMFTRLPCHSGVGKCQGGYLMSCKCVRDEVNIPPVSQRSQPWSQPVTWLSEQETHHAGMQSLPHISYSTTPTQPSSAWAQTSPSHPPPIPRPPLRSRPLSAGAARRSVQGVSGPPVGPAVTRSSVVGGWVNQPIARTTSIPDLQEKEQRLAQLTEEVSRLRNFEFESFRKDTLIQQLQQEIGDLKSKVGQQPSMIIGGDMDMSAKLLHLETEVSAKKQEIAALREQLNKLQNDRSNSPALLRQELGERVKEVTQLRNELERVKKDKNITSGLVTQMQRDMSNKDSTISRLTREIEVLKKDIRERDIQMSSNSARKSKNCPQVQEENSAREKELVNLRQKFKNAENKVQEQMDIITGLREELEKTKAEVLSEKEFQRKIKGELETAKTQVMDLQRSERVVRVDLEQVQKRLERFRNRVIQVTFSTSGVKAPEKELSDDDLIESLKKLMEERARLLAKIKDLEGDVTTAQAGKEELLSHAEKLREILEGSVKRLVDNGRLCASLKQEIDIAQSANTDENLVWIRDMVKSMMEGELAWEHNTEAALEKCGINVKISNDEPSKHIEMLHAKWESSLSDVEKLKAQIVSVEEAHKIVLDAQLKALREEMENKLQDAVEKARLEGEEKLNLAIDEIRAAETEKRESCLDVERRKAAELQASIEQLRKSMAERQAEDQAKLEEASLVLAELEALRNTEKSLKEQIDKLEALRTEDAAQFEVQKEELNKKYEEDLASYKEQIKQHSVTICSMEERVEKLMKKNKDYQEQLSKLRAEKSKPTPPPKPKVIIQRPRDELIALEHVVNALRQENTVLKKEIRDSQDVIMGLRRDLSGASARLSDISGEMSEAQKQEMERNRELLTQKGSELTELRQQMAKLSKIIDSQKEEIKTLEAQLSKEKSISAKFKDGLDQNSSRLQLLEDELNREKEEQRKQLDLLDQEGRITSELTSLGAQCRGERHEQIIARQREALAELRGKVKALEQSRPPLPTQDQALETVIQLKKELAEMRANQAIAEDKVIQNVTSLDREINRARGLITPANVEADMERSAHRETMEALECSEASFLTLLRAIAATLDLEEVEGLRSMAHIPKDEREALMDTRERACQLLANRIQVLKERITRKDDLLQGYETDLAKLRQSQELADIKSQEVAALANDVRSRSEESQYLRESLNRTRDRLNQEKRLNSAIKQKKTFHLENERDHVGKNYRGHHCPVEDPRAAVKKRQQNELLKRKNYEIKLLKENLCEAEKELYHSQKRMASLSDRELSEELLDENRGGCRDSAGAFEGERRNISYHSTVIG